MLYCFIVRHMKKWYIFYRSQILLTERFEIPIAEESPIALQPWNRQQVLPPIDGLACVAVALDQPMFQEDNLRQVGLRDAFDYLSKIDYRMAGKARELLYWDSRTHYCGGCGTPLQIHTEISKKCPQCGLEAWPSPAMAVIVLIERRATDGNKNADEVLLVQAHNFVGDYFALVAGFVETGETLEDAVRREVLEETGLHIKRLRYQTSQPWPFPSVLMAGFIAEYECGELQIQRSELRDARWFRRDALPALPGEVSLARRLIDYWKEGTDHT